MEYSEEMDELKADLRELKAENRRLNEEVEKHLRSDKRDDSIGDSNSGASADISVATEKINVVATFYTAQCPGCIGITKTGLDVRETIYSPDGRRVIAVDPAVIPLDSIVQVTLDSGDSFEAVASDTGGNIKGNRVDILVETQQEAYVLGRQSAKVEIISEGKR